MDVYFEKAIFFGFNKIRNAIFEKWVFDLKTVEDLK